MAEVIKLIEDFSEIFQDEQEVEKIHQINSISQDIFKLRMQDEASLRDALEKLTTYFEESLQLAKTSHSKEEFFNSFNSLSHDFNHVSQHVKELETHIS